MKRLTMLTIVALCGCATGFGEEATGFVDARILPVGDASGGVRFDEATLFVGALELVAAEVDEDEGDEGHGHSHLVAALHAGAHADGGIDLLGGAQALEHTETRAAAYEALHLELEAAIGGEADGCILFATGEALLDEVAVPVRICVPPDGHAAEMPIAFDVGLDETVELDLVVDVDHLLHDVSLAGLERGADGSVRIDGSHNVQALEQVQINLESAFSAAVHADDHDDHDGHDLDH